MVEWTRDSVPTSSNALLSADLLHYGRFESLARHSKAEAEDSLMGLRLRLYPFTVVRSLAQGEYSQPRSLMRSPIHRNGQTKKKESGCLLSLSERVVTRSAAIVVPSGYIRDRTRLGSLSMSGDRKESKRRTPKRKKKERRRKKNASETSPS